MWLFASGFFHLAQHFRDSHQTMYQHSVPFVTEWQIYVYATFCVPTHLFIDIWVISTFLTILNVMAMNFHVQVSLDFFPTRQEYTSIYPTVIWIFVLSTDHTFNKWYKNLEISI